MKKRVTKAISLLRAWEHLMPRPAETPGNVLDALVFGDASSEHDLTGGARVARGARIALLERQNRYVAAQVADVCVCGALPPYGPLLGGKLAALAALSRDVAERYHARYDGRVSEITSQMAGESYSRPADLLALTTTSFYGVGSSQYERLGLDVGQRRVRWRFVGFSGGHGTLHFSPQTSESLDALLSFETGRRLITSRFGEGPSERLRKIRDGLTRLGLPPDVLLQHGMPRRVYVAELSPGACRPGAREVPTVWRDRGPSMQEVAEFWRTRWLRGRLTAEVVDGVARFDRAASLLSARWSVDEQAGDT